MSVTIEDLRELPSLGEYTDAELSILLGGAPARAYPAGSVVCRQGAPGTACFLVVTGAIEVFKGGPDGAGAAERVLATFGRGAFLGQIALVDRAPRSASMRARTDTVALELPRQVFEQLLAACSPFALRFQHQIAMTAIRHLRSATDRLAALETPARSAVPAPTEVASSLELTDEWALSLEPDEVEEVRVVLQPPRFSTKRPG